MASLIEAHTVLTLATRGRAFTDITAAVGHWLAKAQAGSGLVTIFIRHTSASLLIQENTDPDVQADLSDLLAVLAPENRRWRHSLEGPDDMPAHAKSMLTATTLSIPVIAGRMTLGQWQAVYIAEHRSRPQSREVVLSFIGRPASGPDQE
jgi:secondary thiamine-phosphate synthase enzyme